MQANALRSQLLRGGFGSVFIKLSGIGFGLAQTVLLARILGPSGYGIYTYVFALVAMLSILAKFGLPNLLIRETARGQVDGRWENVNGVWRWSILVVSAISGILLTAAGMCLWIWSDGFTDLQVDTFLWGLVLIPFLALSSMVGAALRGLHRVIQGQLPEFVLWPAIFVALIVVAVLLGQKLTASQAMMLRAAAAAGALTIGLWLLLRQESSRVALQTRPKYEKRGWLRSTLPLAFTAGMLFINQRIDILMLGLFAPSETVGTYSVAARGSMLVGFGLQAVNMITGPHFVRFYHQGKIQQLQKLVTLSARSVLLLTLPVAVAFIAFGSPIIRLVFGSVYVMASTPLAILAVGQLVSVVFGSVGILLNMTGHEKDTARGVGIAALANIALNLMLIPLFGMNGAAIATACSLCLWNTLLAHAVFKRIGVKTLAFHRLAG